MWTQEGWLYLAVVLDLCSRLVGGWAMAARQDAPLREKALDMAVARRCPQAGFLHHSDRGRTYTSESYQELVLQQGMMVRMSRTANWYDHAVTESFFHSLKGECIDRESFPSRAQVVNALPCEQLLRAHHPDDHARTKSGRAQLAASC
jgi:transposase InsO family protein